MGMRYGEGAPQENKHIGNQYALAYSRRSPTQGHIVPGAAAINRRRR